MPTHIRLTVITAEPASDKAASNKKAKYRHLTNSYIFVPIVTETAGTWNHQEMELVKELGRQMTAVSEDKGSNLSVPTGKFSLLPQHFHHRVNTITCLVFNILPSGIKY